MTTLDELDASAPFAGRHIGTNAEDQARMLAAVGYGSIEELVAAAVPGSIADRGLDLPAAADEAAVLAELRALAARNTTATSMIGLGYADTVTPPVIRRNILENPAWYTAYTPYQPEISPGAAGGTAQLPDHGRRPDRAADGEREPAGRGDRGGRGGGARPAGVHGPAGRAGGPSTPTACRRRSR